MGKFSVGIVGSISDKTAPYDRPGILVDERVQELLAGLAPEPLSRRAVGSRWPDLQAQVDQLIHLTALRVEQDRLCINFPMMTQEDVRRIWAVSERAAASLGQRFMAKGAEFSRLFAQYPFPRVGPEKLAFMIVGGYFLDWNCLSILKEHGYMAGPAEMPGGNHYTLNMSADCDELSLQGVYWGCHGSDGERYRFNTFGDHASTTRRLAYPDLIWAAVGAVPAELGETREATGRHLVRILDEAAVLLESVGPTGMPTHAAGSMATASGGEVRPLVAMLRELGYLREEEGRLHVGIPFFRGSELGLVRSVFDLARPILLDWLSGYYGEWTQELRKITCLRHGVPMDVAMIFIWHYLFGLTNRYLARAGFMWDTYREGAQHRGYLPGVYPVEWGEFANL